MRPCHAGAAVRAQAAADLEPELSRTDGRRDNGQQGGTRRRFSREPAPPNSQSCCRPSMGSSIEGARQSWRDPSRTGARSRPTRTASPSALPSAPIRATWRAAWPLVQWPAGSRPSHFRPANSCWRPSFGLAFPIAVWITEKGLEKAGIKVERPDVRDRSSSGRPT